MGRKSIAGEWRRKKIRNGAKLCTFSARIAIAKWPFSLADSAAHAGFLRRFINFHLPSKKIRNFFKKIPCMALIQNLFPLMEVLH
jgi:hypothetical protein